MHFYAISILIGVCNKMLPIVCFFVDKFWIFENFFDMPVGLLCARMVDCLDKQVLMLLMCYMCVSYQYNYRFPPILIK